MSWTEIPDVRTLVIYGLLTLVSAWFVALVNDPWMNPGACK